MKIVCQVGHADHSANVGEQMITTGLGSHTTRTSSHKSSSLLIMLMLTHTCVKLSDLLWLKKAKYIDLWICAERHVTIIQTYGDLVGVKLG